jgi:Xaa-Pro aminopeptidase
MEFSFFRKNAEKVRKEMQKRGIDVCILTNQQKYSYIAGTFHNDFNLGNCLFVWKDKEPTFLVALAERRRLMYEGYITDVRNWIPDYADLQPKSFNDCVGEVLREFECGSKVIAIESPSIPWVFYDFLTKQFPRAEFVDCEEMLNELMMVKDEEELELTRRCCAIADAGTRQIIENAHVGITEAELMGHAEKEMRRLGASYYYTPNQCLFGMRLGGGDHMPTDRILVNNSMIYYDLHPVWNEYRTDSFRTMAFGEPDKDYMKMMEVIRRIIPELNAKMILGASTVDIERWYLDEMKKAGYPDRGSVPLGHGIGTGHLPPFFFRSKNDILKENVLISVCGHINNPELMISFALEYIICIKPGRPEIMTHWPLDLIIIK